MIEIILRDYLEQMVHVPVYMEFPKDPPERFVVLRKGDTSRENWLETTVFIPESYAESMLSAAKLNGLIKTCMDSLVNLPEISASRLGTDYPAFDNKNNRYRYQAVYDVTHY